MVINNDVASNEKKNIQISHSSSNLIQNNDVTNSLVGILLDWSPYNKILDNNAGNNKYHGITLGWLSDNNLIGNNLAVENDVGLFIQLSSNNTIENNNADDNMVGINLEWSSNNNTITDNTVNNSNFNGISLNWLSNDNTISGNIANNCQKGFYFDEHSTGNGVYNNVLCGNSIYDIDDDDSNSGDDNKCEFTDNWDDLGTSGCTDGCVLPTIIITTDKSQYAAGDTMNVGLNISNPGSAITVGIDVWIDLPSGIYPYYSNPSVTLPAGFEYHDPTWVTIILPSIAPGDYAWHATLYDPVTSVVISESISPWTFTGVAVSDYNTFEKVFQGISKEIEIN